MNRTRAVLCALLIALSVAAVGPAAAQEDLVTLTVSVETSGGDLVRGATVTATWDGGSTSATTVSNGQALMDVPEGADVELSVTHDDYVRNFPLAVSDASAGEVSMTVYEKASARVVVEDSAGPVSEATVTLRKGGNDVFEEPTGGAGVVTSGTIEAGTYTVVVRKPGYYVVEQSLDVEGDTETTVTVERGTVTLEVNVTDEHFEPPQPVGGASVEVAGSGSVVTQPAGIGRISVPVNAWADISVTKDGYRTTEVSEFIAESDEELELSIQRQPALSVDLLSSRVVIGESVSLSVTDEYGDPVEGATVRMDGTEVAQTDGSGQAVVQVPSDGNHTVTVQTDALEATAYVEGVTAGEVEGDGGTTEAPTEGGAGTTAAPFGQPGFGAGVALLALVALVVIGLARRRGRS